MPPTMHDFSDAIVTIAIAAEATRADTGPGTGTATPLSFRHPHERKLLPIEPDTSSPSR
jgi:hypothetical protein